ncbi:MAG: DUF1844 domain-containing protein [Terracidiphilus sp.]
MSDKPKFEVIDRRKMKAEEEHEGRQQPATPAEAAPAPGGGPHLVVNESKSESRREPAPAATPEVGAVTEAELPSPPTAQESREQKAAYDASSQRLEDMVRAQNPAAGAPPQISFEHLVQQFYVSAMIQMGAGTQEGQHPRVDILGARTTIDLLGVLAEKTKGNLTEAEDKILQTILFELRMAFLELTNMITSQGIQPPPPKKKA